MKKILCVGLVVSFGVILSLGFSKKSYAKIDHNFFFLMVEILVGVVEISRVVEVNNI